MKKTIFISVILLIAAMGADARSIVRDTLNTGSAVNVSPAQLLKGQVSGVHVSGTDGSITGALNTVIRGLSAVHTDSEPLWIIDGAYMTTSIGQNRNAFWQESYKDKSYTSALNPFYTLNPYDIESIEVLKDLAATSIYGSRGANGVIIVKTKLPRKDGQSVRWASNLGVNLTSHGYTSISHNHNVSFSSRHNRNAFHLSAFFRNDSGAMERSEDNVGGVRLNFDSQANKVMWFGVGASIMKGRQDAQNSIGWYGSQTATQLLRKVGDYSGFVKDFDDYSNDIRSTDNVYFQINFLQNLYLRGEAGIDYSNNTRHIWYGNGTEFGKSLNGAAALLSSSMLMYTAKGLLNYSLFATDRHRLTFEAGAEYSGSIDKFNTMNGKGFFTHEMRSKGLSINEGKAHIHMFDRALSNFGAYGNVSWLFSNIAGATVSFRADRTLVYDDAFNLYPAGSAWFDLAKVVLPGNEVVGSLKLKGGWGRAGRDTFAPYEMFGNFIPNLKIDGVVEGTEILYEGFDKIISSEWNVGVELSMLKGRINVEAGYYEKVTDDVFSAYCFGEQKGQHDRWFRSDKHFMTSDKASMRNRGIELSVNAVAIKTGDWKWAINANAAFLSSQITAVSDEATVGSSVGKDVVIGANAVGHPVSCIYGYKTDADGNFVDHTGDGKIGTEDKVMLARTVPVCHGGLSTVLSWKGLSLDIQTDYAVGQSLLNMNRMLDDGASDVSDKYVEAADFFRLSRVSLCYDIPVRKPWLKKLTVSLAGNNLLIASPYSGYNPDVNSFFSPYSRGADYGTAPLARAVVAGVSLTF